MKTETATRPALFLTDYASYNHGKQFEFGHWIELENFADAEEFGTYVSNHFKEADKKSPLDPWTKREEPMYTDYEGIPSELYGESLGPADLEAIFEFIYMDEADQIRVEYLLEQGNNAEQALETYEDVTLWEYTGVKDLWYLYEELYPEQSQMADRGPYLTVNYEQFKNELFTEFTDRDGNSYLVMNQ